VNVINWVELASHFTFRRHTAKMGRSVMYITDRASWGAQNPNLIRPPPLCAGLGRLSGALGPGLANDGQLA
jgi:hypothetical protein